MTKQSRATESGYSLVEMLVVLAIVGVLSLVTVPQFMTFYKQNKMRTAVRQFTSDIRGARQRAITLNAPTAISFTPGATPAGGGVRGRYAIYTLNGGTWTMVGGYKNLDQAVYFINSDFPVDSGLADNMQDVVFLPNGTVSNLPSSPSTPLVVIKSDNKVPNNRCTLTFSTSGSFTSALSTDS
jgi:prepilin-type N-terminal cleavage/methylation domain-containing protein